MNFKLVHQTDRQRFYESDVEIIKFPNGRFDLEKELEYSKSRLKEGVEMLNDKVFIVCVSDAHTHLERLVFAATKYKLPDGEVIYSPMSMQHIDGAMTMRIHGGDAKSMKPDEVYLRHIKMHNETYGGNK
jgi:hypothetical protein